MFESLLPDQNNTWNTSFKQPFTNSGLNLDSTSEMLPPRTNSAFNQPEIDLKNLTCSGDENLFISHFSVGSQSTQALNSGSYNSTSSAEKSAVDPLTGEVLSNDIVEQALQSAQGYLKGFATDPDFNAKMNLAFGNSWNTEVASELVQEFTQGNFSNLPEIEILPSATLDGANGAFASVNNTIYLSQEFIAQNAGNPEAITSVLLEETGHYIDSKINVSDAAGDEGDIFSRLAQGQTISADALLELKAEDDTATIMLAGKHVLIEQSSTFRGTVDAQVNVRSGPGTNFGVVGILNPGNSRTFDNVNTGTTHWDAREQQNENRWFRIQGTNNWVSAAFITGTPNFSGSVDAQLNVRSGPGTNFGIVSSLNAGNRPTFDGVNVGTNHWDAREGKNENRWFRLQGTDNWVSAAFITGEPTGSNSTPMPTPFNQQEYFQRLYSNAGSASSWFVNSSRPGHDAIDSTDTDSRNGLGVRALVGGVVIGTPRNGTQLSDVQMNNTGFHPGLGRRVTASNYNGEVVIWNPDLNRRFIYLHFAPGSINLRNGDRVNPGDIIGIEGNTGWSIGRHTHLQVRAGQSGGAVEDPLVTLGNARSQGILNRNYR